MTMMDRNSAVKHAPRLCERRWKQERCRLHTELESVRGRLALAEKDLVETKEGCIHLTDTVQSLEREVRLIWCLICAHMFTDNVLN